MLGNAEVVVASAASVAFAVGCVAVVVAASSLLADGTVAVEGSVAASDVGIAVVGLRSVAVSECVQEQPYREAAEDQG